MSPGPLTNSLWKCEDGGPLNGQCCDGALGGSYSTVCLNPLRPSLTVGNVYVWIRETMTEIDKFDNKGRGWLTSFDDGGESDDRGQIRPMMEQSCP